MSGIIDYNNATKEETNRELSLDMVKSTVRDHWDIHSKYYDGTKIDHEDGADSRFSDELTAIIGIEKKTIMDVGSGTGYVSIILARLGHKVTGIDFSKRMLAISTEKAKKLGLDIEFIEGDAENIRLEDNRYDIIINRHLLWTLPNPEKAVKEWARLTKPGGKMIIIDGRQNTYKI